MKIKVINGSNKKAKKIIDWIVGIYERDAKYFSHSGFTVSNPRSLTIIYIENVGGIIIDRIGNKLKKDQFLFCCQYLAVEPEHTKKGIARLLVKHAQSFATKHKTRLAGAYVDGSDQMELWDSLGYKHAGNIGFSLVMLDSHVDDVFS